MSHAFYLTAQGGENAAYLVPETLREKNVAGFYRTAQGGEKAAYLIPETL